MFTIFIICLLSPFFANAQSYIVFPVIKIADGEYHDMGIKLMPEQDKLLFVLDFLKGTDDGSNFEAEFICGDSKIFSANFSKNRIDIPELGVMTKVKCQYPGGDCFEMKFSQDFSGWKLSGKKVIFESLAEGSVEMRPKESCLKTIR